MLGGLFTHDKIIKKSKKIVNTKTQESDYFGDWMGLRMKDAMIRVPQGDLKVLVGTQGSVLLNVCYIYSLACMRNL